MTKTTFYHTAFDIVFNFLFLNLGVFAYLFRISCFVFRIYFWPSIVFVQPLSSERNSILG